ncbi:MAG: hypothetical protein JNL87_10965 [Burkholderiaceae bacterium]|nr:hypothetical protein [Burkholderiaceae bacterium]
MLLATFCALPGHARAQGAPGLGGWQFGAVLDVAYTTHTLALGGRDQGPQLGHSDLTASGPLGSWFTAKLTATVETHERKLEGALEEAWLETTRLPAGLQMRAGRFASQIGYLNQQHPHADDFVERPLLYRGFYGGHWNDDGLRLNWTAPTPFYLMLGVEAFRGKRLVEETANEPGRPGVTTFVVKTGADLGRSHSWQLGLSYIRNRREAAVEDHAEEEDEHDHDHHHGAQFTGGKTWMIDGVWKWAPDGNSRNQQLRAGFEAGRITDLNRYATPQDRDESNSIRGVWRFRPDWEVGARADWLRVRIQHGEHFDNGLLREAALMAVWKPSHMQSLRLQFTTQWDAVGFADPAKRTVQLQYVIAFGAHGAHAY